METKVILNPTQPEIDAVVLSGYPLFTFSGGLITHHHVEFPPVVGDWSLKIIGDHGNGAGGWVVATPRSSRSRALFKRGRVTELVRVLGSIHSSETIEQYADAAEGTIYCWEKEVVDFVLRTRESLTIDQLNEVLTAAPAFKAKLAEFNVQTRLSQWRLKSALEILLKLESRSKEARS